MTGPLTKERMSYGFPMDLRSFVRGPVKCGASSRMRCHVALIALIGPWLPHQRVGRGGTGSAGSAGRRLAELQDHFHFIATRAATATSPRPPRPARLALSVYGAINQ